MAAIAALKADNEAFRDRVESQISQKYDQRRERLLLSSVQTLEALDRAIDAARATDAAEALIAGVMLVRTQLFRILQEEGLERMSVLGLPYDRRTSEVIERRPVKDPDQDGVVIEELQGGHHLRGHILRRAKVVVGEFTDEESEPTVVMKAYAPEPAAAPEPTAAMPIAGPEPTVAMPELSPEPTVAMPALADDKKEPPPVPGEPPAEVTVAMRAGEIEAVMARKAGSTPGAAQSPPPLPAKAAAPPATAKPSSPAVPAVPPPPRIPSPPRASAPPPVATPPAPTPPADAEEPIVVEDWAESTQAAEPSTVIEAPAVPASRGADSDWSETQTDAAPRGRHREAPPPPPPDDAGEDDGASATMVLADSASLFARPGPAAQAPPPPRTGSAFVSAASEAEEWETPAQWEGDPNATHPVPRDERVTPPRPVVPRPATATPAPRPRATVPPPTPPRARASAVAGSPGGGLRGRAAAGVEPTPAPPTPAWRPPPATASHAPVGRPPRRGRGSGFYAGLAVVLVVLLTALGIEMWLLLGAKRGPDVAEASPSPGDALQTPPPATAPVILEEDIITVPQPQPEPVFEPSPATDLVQTPPPPGALPTVAPATPAPVAVTPPPPRPTTPAPAPVVNPAPGLLAQAEQAQAAGKFSEAIRLYGEVLKLEPDNKEASAGRLRATGERASQGRYFLTDVTLSEGKASGGKIKGFDGAEVVKSPCECAITYEVNPENPRQDQPYSVGIYLQNDSKKDIKPQTLRVVVTVNGARSPRSVPLQAKEVSRGQRVLIGTLEDTWKLGTTSWKLDAAVGAGDNTYRAQLSWELKL